MQSNPPISFSAPVHPRFVCVFSLAYMYFVSRPDCIFLYLTTYLVAFSSVLDSSLEPPAKAEVYKALSASPTCLSRDSLCGEILQQLQSEKLWVLFHNFALHEGHTAYCECDKALGLNAHESFWQLFLEKEHLDTHVEPTTQQLLVTKVIKL